MAGEQMKPVASLLLVLNFCMYVIVLGIGGWAMNRAIDRGFEIGFFVTFALLAGVVGGASTISGLTHIRSWTVGSLPAAAMAATIAWTLTVLAMGFAWKEIEFQVRNAKLRTMEAFLIILSVTQLLYIAAVHGVKKPT